MLYSVHALLVYEKENCGDFWGNKKEKYAFADQSYPTVNLKWNALDATYYYFNDIQKNIEIVLLLTK